MFKFDNRFLITSLTAASFLFSVLISANVEAQTTPTSPPLVDFATQPLYIKSNVVKPTLTLALSVEFPTTGAAYRDEFDTTKTYIGYYDYNSCYEYNLDSSNSSNRYFKWLQSANRVEVTSPAGISIECSAGFSGNYLNWATTSAIDILRYALTGGDRIIDESNRTVLQRAILRKDYFWYKAYWPRKEITKTVAAKVIPSSLLANVANSGIVTARSCLDKFYLGVKPAGYTEDSNGMSTYFCSSPGGFTSLLPANNGLTPDNFFYARVQVCNSSTSNQLAEGYYNGGVYDEVVNKKRIDFCGKYPNGKFKPIGNLQKYSDQLRVAVFGYLTDRTTPNQRHGGVLRAPMKYVGPTYYNNQFIKQADINPSVEWNIDTGVFVSNPLSVGRSNNSGVINYINKFGRLVPYASLADDDMYKTFDPIGELYYEAVRYLQGIGPTPANKTKRGPLTDAQNYEGGFAYYGDSTYGEWDDPISAWTSTSDTDYSCVKNNIMLIGDNFSHNDKTIPGSSVSGGDANDKTWTESSNPAMPNFSAWTNTIGNFEKATTPAVAYPDGAARTASNPFGSTGWLTATNLADAGTGSGGNSSYLWSGVAFWAHVNDFRPTGMADNKARPGSRITTFTIDVNENSASTLNVSNFRKKQAMYLAAKYGGFDNSDGSDNPYVKKDGTSDNSRWANIESGGAVGDPKNYFLASDPVKLINAINDIFKKSAENLNSVAGGGNSGARLTDSSSSKYLFTSSFDFNNKIGDVKVRTLSRNADGSLNVSPENTAAWSAKDYLNSSLSIASNVVARNVVVGHYSSAASGATFNSYDFKWGTALPTGLKDLLKDSSVPANVSDPNQDILAEKNLNWIRGDRANESSLDLRVRSGILGDIVNSSVVYYGGPSKNINDNGYKTFYDLQTGTSRNHKMLYVGANDGMLHAFKFDEVTPANTVESFAYIPSFVTKNLNKLPKQDYGHQAYVDATPAVYEANTGTTSSPSWKSILIGGAGAGGQGVYALDVSEPTSFNKDSVLWEFSERDDPKIGNVLGTPQILKFKLSSTTGGVTTSSYKWFAVVAGGVNNQLNDGYSESSGVPYLFILDISKPRSDAWTPGVNYYRLNLPLKSSLTTVPGVINFTATANADGSVDKIYAGDLHGQLWRLDFSRFSNTADWTTTNLSSISPTVNTTAVPFFSATSTQTIGGVSTVLPRAITARPLVFNGPNKTKIVSIATGKYLETSDTSGPDFTKQAVYALLDDSTNVISSEASLASASINAAGDINVTPFVWGYPTSGTDTVNKQGWYFELPNQSVGELNFNPLVPIGDKFVVTSVQNGPGMCKPADGNMYVLPTFGNKVGFAIKNIGVQGPPMVIATNVTGGLADSTGASEVTEGYRLIGQGSKGLTDISRAATSVSYVRGRLSWRQVQNIDNVSY